VAPLRASWPGNASRPRFCFPFGVGTCPRRGCPWRGTRNLGRDRFGWCRLRWPFRPRDLRGTHGGACVPRPRTVPTMSTPERSSSTWLFLADVPSPALSSALGAVRGTGVLAHVPGPYSPRRRPLPSRQPRSGTRSDACARLGRLVCFFVPRLCLAICLARLGPACCFASAQSFPMALPVVLGCSVAPRGTRPCPAPCLMFAPSVQTSVTPLSMLFSEPLAAVKTGPIS